jgi:anti-anti-sigma factor
MADVESNGDAAQLAVTGTVGSDGLALLAVCGEVDISNVGQLSEAVDAALQEGASAIAFDLGQLAFIDSAGLAMLAAAARRVDSLTLKDPSPIVARVIELSGLSPVLPIQP